MIIWIIGMSASGKTTLGNEMYKILKEVEPWVFLDGDLVRAFLGQDLGHSVEDRKINSYRISNLCRFLETQGINVIACVLSIFHENQQYNRSVLSNYKEIFIDVDFEKLIKRDNKNLYQKALKGELKDFVGVDIDFPKPLSPDITINNNEDNTNMTSVALKIIADLNLLKNINYKYSANNKLENPEKYQYSAFLGEEFLNSYEKSRTKIISLLKDRANKLFVEEFSQKNNFEKIDVKKITNDLKNNMCFSENKIILKQKENISDLLIRTDYYLFNLFNKITHGLDLTGEEIIELETLLKRFEVTKKIREKYKYKTFLKISNDSDDLINYILFSNILLTLIEKNSDKNKKFIYFNTVIKLNDIIASCVSKLFKKEEMLLTCVLFEKELNYFNKLKRKKIC